MRKIINTVAMVSVVIFISTSVILGQRYIAQYSPQKNTKGGTLLELYSGNINYLPYTSEDSRDLYRQSELYRGCSRWLQGSVSDDICKVSTRDYKTYTIGLNTKNIQDNLTGNSGMYNSNIWSDGHLISIDDVYWTYYQILISNTWKIPFLNTYDKIKISKIGDSIKVVFPRASRDNKLFFLNPILPSHILSSKDLSFYTKIFAQDIVNSSCISIKKDTSDPNSLIFDMNKCDSLYKQYYQYKKYPDQDLYNVLGNSQNIIDIQTYGATSDYTAYTYISDKLFVSFFNTSTTALDRRRNMYFYLKGYSPENIVPYQKYLFDLGISTSQLISYLSNPPKTTAPVINIPKNEIKLPSITHNIYIYGKEKTKTYYLDNVGKDGFRIKFKLDQAYQKVGIGVNGGGQYFPESHNTGNNTVEYTLSPKYNTIRRGLNTYTIWGYIDAQPVKLLTIKLYYQTKPSNSTTANTVLNNIAPKTIYKIIYLQNNETQAWIDGLKEKFKKDSIDKYFVFESIANQSQLDGKIASKDYDMVVKLFAIGHKRDLSSFLGSDVSINPSNYKNPDIEQKVSDFSMGYSSVKDDINDAYSKNIPFAIVGNLKNTFYIKNRYIPTSGLNTELDSSRRGYMMNNIKLTQQSIIDRDKLLDLKQILEYILSH